MAVPTEDREEAIGSLRRRREFTTRLATFAGVLVLVWIVWALTADRGDGIPWAVWPTLGLFIAVAFDFRRAFANRSITDSHIQREIERRRRRP